jgi:hypothetical protein
LGRKQAACRGGSAAAAAVASRERHMGVLGLLRSRCAWGGPPCGVVWTTPGARPTYLECYLEYVPDTAGQPADPPDTTDPP